MIQMVTSHSLPSQASPWMQSHRGIHRQNEKPWQSHGEYSTSTCVCSEFKEITDHKPLVTLFNNPYSKPTTRIERWILKLQQYQPGKSNPSDFMSRHPSETTDNIEETTEEFINLIVNHAVPKYVTQ